jgi:hypothetical protein
VGNSETLTVFDQKSKPFDLLAFQTWQAAKPGEESGTQLNYIKIL